MSAGMPIMDEDLVAYLDGELDHVRRSAVDTALAADEALAARLAALDIDRGAIRVALDAVAAAAPVERLRRQLDSITPLGAKRDRRRLAPWVATAAALVLGLALGYALGFGAVPDPMSNWHVAVADYQILYTTATLAPLSNDPAVQRSEVSAVSLKLGVPVGLEALQIPGLEFKRAQLLEFNGRPLAQFAYLDQGGVPIAFCVTRTGGADQAVRAGRFTGLAAAYWNKGGFGYIVIGATDATVLQRAAAILAERI